MANEQIKITEERRTMIAEALFNFWSEVLENEQAPGSARKEAAAVLTTYRDPRLAALDPLLKRFGK